MAEAVDLAATAAEPGTAVLLSPACSSFDCYSGYAARGEDFIRVVRDTRPSDARNARSRCRSDRDRAQPRPPRQALVEARARHATARVPADGRGPRPPIGRRTGLFLALFLSVIALVLLGLVMALSATAAPSLSGTDSAWSLFKSQAMWLGVGLIALLVLLAHRLPPLEAARAHGPRCVAHAPSAHRRSQRRPERQRRPPLARSGIHRVPALGAGQDRLRGLRSRPPVPARPAYGGRPGRLSSPFCC